MSTTQTSGPLRLRRMLARDPKARSRSASPLELFFDLVFVVAVSLSSAQLHHAEAGHHPGSGIGGYAMLFIAIWWAWMNFTWFASAFDTDDWLYRVTTFVQMGGVLVLAAGAAPAISGGDFTVATIGYVVMRVALVSQWLRAAASDPSVRGPALRYAGAILVIQVFWVARLFLPDQGGAVSFLLLAALELAVPVFAERRGGTPWHSGHIAERYGLFTIIVLGESILASTGAVVDAIADGEHLGPLLVVAASGLCIAAGMWWMYFTVENNDLLTTTRRALVFGYGHYFIFAAAGAFSAGIEIAIDRDTHAVDLDAGIAAATLTVPVAVYVIAVWVLTLRPKLSSSANVLVPILALCIAGAALVPFSLPVTAGLIIALVVIVETGRASTLVSAEPRTGTHTQRADG
ncbi:low temperature requirement protein A [Plantibacter sp. YIM 135347]|uniref:low temperature requirement protein A n=1 Tax=Plantibacter sp. YIM 135347 TaxID=3423919 RepID=UPI003D358F11